jgi:hypothetical protein
MKLHQAIESQLERYNNFEAAMDMLCLFVAELRNVIYSEDMTSEKKINKIKQIKDALIAVKSSRFTQEELRILNNFISQNINLCDVAMSALK